jgi:hypothetical protein
MTAEREQLLEQTIKEMLSANLASSETRDNLIEKLVRQFIDGKSHKISEFEPYMSDSMKKRFQYEINMISIGL